MRQSDNRDQDGPDGSGFEGIKNRLGIFIDPLSHDKGLTRARTREAFWRIRLLMAVFGFVLLGWIVIDVYTLPPETAALLAIGRLAAGGALIALALYAPRPRKANQIWINGGLLIATVSAFYAYAVMILASQPAGAIPEMIIVAYTLIPLVMIAALAMFPLTVLEVAVGAILPFGLMLVTAVTLPGGESWIAAIGLGDRVLFMLALLSVVMLSAGSQIQFMNRVVYELEHDALTGCLTRRAGETRLAEEIRGRETSVVILFLDLDKFSEVNNNFGHECGDEILCNTAAQLMHNLRGTDSVVRWGGEEFLIILPGAGRSGVISVLNRLAYQNGLGLRPDGGQITASVGVAVYPDEALDWRELVKIADQRMYRAKQAGGNAVFPSLNDPDVIIPPTGHQVESLSACVQLENKAAV
ncbi:diguanylate cyclase [Thioalkalivibrio sp. ALE16]|uniref:GGDEF domain-containing protein n=1 Tax=Thioalkalivibrio sp. ALE16 TaxID=1158172 RepID=UPI00037D20D6|nr:GGDEF domain-containing protein [Thioalkalivibrio sp. ALE16]